MSALNLQTKSVVIKFAIALVIGSSTVGHAEHVDDALTYEVKVYDDRVEPYEMRVTAGDSILFRNHGTTLKSAKLMVAKHVLNEPVFNPRTSLLLKVPNDMRTGKYVLSFGDYSGLALRLHVDAERNYDPFGNIARGMADLFILPEAAKR